MTRAVRMSAASVALALATSATAQIPQYAPLQLRARDGTTAYDIPSGMQIGGSRPSINDSGLTAFSFGGSSANIWVGGTTISLTGLGRPRDEVSLNNNGILAWYSGSAPVQGVYRYDTAAHSGALMTNDPGPNFAHRSVVINDQGVFTYFADPNAYHGIAQYDPASGPPHMVVAANDDGSGFSSDGNILGANNAGQVAVLDHAPGRGIARYQPDGSSVIMSGSIFPAFLDLRVSINNAGSVAFLTNQSHISVYRSDGASPVLIASSGPATALNSINDLAPVINDLGWVAFLARGNDLVQGIFVSDGQSLVRVAAIGDTLMTDGGLARITSFTSDTIGAIDMNNRGDIAFFASLTNVSTGLGLGTGLIVAPVPAPTTASLVLLAGLGLGRRRRRDSRHAAFPHRE